ncbi:MAG: DUF354 domain-containing protein, partial [Bacteroidota bacterium]|nr:DUF354 domain-containing protein [Bacteroidota bacterium]
KPLVKIAYPFATNLILPDVCSAGKYSKKKIGIKSYHELAYLHPNYFTPNKKKISKYIDVVSPFFIIRFSGLSAYHDKGKSGITSDLAYELIKILSPHGAIFISAERQLEKEFEKYRISLNPVDIHHALYYADIFIGDSQTMAAESAVLGTPFIRYNDFVGKLGYLDELENIYGLGYGISTLEPQKFLNKVKELLALKNKVQYYRKKREQMLNEKIRYTDFLIWFIENFPKSRETMINNPEYQFNFK